ncbi:MAG: hypothetical protein VX672_10430 [Planctomycetota bacterium]|nr:hypothetical protein [Planctomycetota bacterium]
MIDLVVTILLVAALRGPVVGPQEVPEDPASTPPAPEKEEVPPPSLDDLLEIEGAEGDSDAAIAESDRRDLDAALAEEKPADAFKAAVRDMLISSELLEDRRDTGLGTQRIQQRIIDRLQAMIDSANRQQQPQPQPQSGQSQEPRDPGRQDQPQDQEGRQQEQQQSQDRQGAQDGSSVQPPPPETADLEGALDGAGIEWGGLPPRMRELISQGTRDRVSEMYRSLTEAYYRRMAEEGNR